jgi:hypothetical protein
LLPAKTPLIRSAEHRLQESKELLGQSRKMTQIAKDYIAKTNAALTRPLPSAAPHASL